jgi:hypothetical protein
VPLYFGHVAKVHPVNTGNECRRHKDNSNDGKDLDNLVLLDVDKTKECILEIFQPLRTELRVLEEVRNITYDNSQSLIAKPVEFWYPDQRANDSLFFRNSLMQDHNVFLELRNAEEQVLL